MSGLVSAFLTCMSPLARVCVKSAVLAFCVAAVSVNIVSANDLTKPSLEDLQTQMEAKKLELESSKAFSPVLITEYEGLATAINNCSPKYTVTEPIFREMFTPRALLAPQASLCLAGALTNPTDPTFNRPTTASQGSGFGPFPPGSCTLSGSVTTARYDVYNFRVTGCAAFPTVVTASLCGPAGCLPAQSLDTVLVLYRRVASGDPLTADGGLGGAFNPAAPCTNAVALNDDTGGTASASGGSTCNQSNTADCLPGCATSTSLSQLKRSIGSGIFTLVVSGFGNATVGNYNLYVNAPAAGCVITGAAATAASVSVGGRVTAGKRGIANARVTLTNAAGESKMVITSAFGYFRFTEVAAGETYTISAFAKNYSFSQPTQIRSITADTDDVNFVAAN